MMSKVETAGEAGRSRFRGLPVGLVYSWINKPEALLPLAAEWQQLATQTHAEIYLMPAWFALWWAHFGAGRQLACLVARQGEALVGVIPFCIETFWLGPLRLRVARLAGTDPHCMVFGIPLVPDCAPDILHEACRHLLGPGGCDAVSLTPVSERADFLPWVRQIGADHADLTITERPGGSHVIFDLPGSFDSYLASLSKKRRSQFRRDVSALQDRFGMTTRAGVPGAAEFDAFVGFHNQQWQAVGKGGHFSDWPGSAAFYRELTARSTPDRGVRFEYAEGRDGPLATQFALLGGQTCHWRLPARTLDAEADKLSIGKVGLLLMIQNMIEAGICRIEAGRGDYDYKLSYGGVSVPVHQILITRTARASDRRLHALLVWSDLIHLLYYRLWFLKLRPRLRRLIGGKPRPLRRLWIRTRV